MQDSLGGQPLTKSGTGKNVSKYLDTRIQM